LEAFWVRLHSDDVDLLDHFFRSINVNILSYCIESKNKINTVKTHILHPEKRMTTGETKTGKKLIG